MPPTEVESREAAERIRPYANRTPIVTSQTLNELTGSQVFLKCENLQKTGSFKFRGACNAVFSLTDAEAARGVVTYSSGNHAQAVALSARLRGIPAFIVMHNNAPQVKKAAVAGYGGKIYLCEPVQESREGVQDQVIAETGAIPIHAYDNERVIAGQSTIAREILEEIPDVDVIMTPVGGGGMLSGTVVAAKSHSRPLRIIAGEPELADDAFQSLAAGRIIPVGPPRTIADGLLTSLGKLTFPLIREGVERIITVSEAEIVAAMRFVWERVKLIIEPSAAVPVAALLSPKADLRGQRVCVVLSGGNVDLDHLPWQK